MESSFVINLHFKNKITQKKISSNFDMFKNQLFKFTSINELGSNYLIEYYEKRWIVLDEEKFKRLSNLFKKEVRIVINPLKVNVLYQLSINIIEKLLIKNYLKNFKNYYKLLRESRLKRKKELNQKISEKKMNEYLNLVTSDNSYQNNRLENNFNLYYTLNELVPAYKRIHINFIEMNLKTDNLEE